MVENLNQKKSLKTKLTLRQTGVLILFTVALFFCIRNIYFAWDYYSQAKITSNWKKCIALVQKSKIGEITKKGDEDETLFYYPVITYTFKYKNQRINSSNLYRKIPFKRLVKNDEPAVDNLIKAYPAGKTIEIFYDPVNPQECAIFIRPLKNSQWLMITSIIFLIFIFPAHYYLYKNF